MGPNKQILRIDRAWSVQTARLEDVLQDNLDSLYRFALRLSQDTAEAQDLVQETATRAWERRNTGVQNWRAWLFQTLYHAFISSRRHRHRWKEAGEGAWDEELGPCDSVPPLIRTEDVRRAVEALADELRAVVWLSDAEEMPLRDVAQILGWPVGTVASRLWRARSELRKLLSAYKPPGEKQL